MLIYLDGQQGSYYYAASNPSGYQTGTGTVAQSHYVSGTAFATNGPDSVLEYAQSASVSDTKLAPSTDWHNSIRMGHGDPYSYYSSAIAIRMTGSGPGDLYTQTIQGGTGGGWSKHWSARNDGSGSGLDADLLDGLDSASFLRSDVHDTGVGLTINGGTLNSPTDSTLYVTASNNNDWGITIGAASGKTEYGMQIQMPSSFTYALRILKNGSEHFNVNSTGATIGGNYIWHAGNDGSGSGLDADLLDGIDSARVVYASGTNAMGVSRVGFASLTNSRAGFYDIYNSGTPTGTWYSLVNMPHSSANHGHQIAGSFYSAGDIYNRNNNNTSLSAWAKIWNTVNDGAGSGLVADYATKVTFNTQGNSNTTLKLLLGDTSNSTIASGTVYKDNELSYNTSSNTLNTGSINFSNWSYTDYKDTGSGGQHYVHNGNGGSDQTIDGSQGSSNLRTLGVSSTGELGQDIVEQSFTYTRAQFHAMSLTPFEILNFDDGRGSNPGRIPVILEVLLMLSYSSPVQTCIGSGSGNWIELVQDHHLTNKIIAGFTCGSVQLMCGNSGARCALIYQDRKSRLYYAEKPLKFRRTSTNTTLHSNVTHIHLKVRYKFYDGASF